MFYGDHSKPSPKPGEKGGQDETSEVLPGHSEVTVSSKLVMKNHG